GTLGVDAHARAVLDRIPGAVAPALDDGVALARRRARRALAAAAAGRRVAQVRARRAVGEPAGDAGLRQPARAAAHVVGPAFGAGQAVLEAAVRARLELAPQPAGADPKLVVAAALVAVAALADAAAVVDVAAALADLLGLPRAVALAGLKLVARAAKARR